MKDKSSGRFKSMGYYKETTKGVRNIIEIFECINEAGIQDLNKEKLVKFGGHNETYDSPGKRRRTGVSVPERLSSPSPSTPHSRRGCRSLRQGGGGRRDIPTPLPASRDAHHKFYFKFYYIKHEQLI